MRLAFLLPEVAFFGVFAAFLPTDGVGVFAIFDNCYGFIKGIDNEFRIQEKGLLFIYLFLDQTQGNNGSEGKG